MSTVYKVLCGIGALIAVYLVLVKSSNTTAVISTISTNAISGIKTLQGR